MTELKEQKEKKKPGRPAKTKAVMGEAEVKQLKEVILYYRPHPKQLEVHNSKAKFIMCCAGRRSGKTVMCVGAALRLIEQHWNDKRKLQIAWISPTFSQCGRGITVLKEKVGRDFIKNDLMEIKGISPVVATINGHKIIFLSADNADSIRGYWFDMCIIDEAALISDKAFSSVILPTLMDKGGKVIAISTPAGTSGWFYNYCQKSISDKEIDFFKFSSYDNPYLKPEDIELIKSEMSELEWKQEGLAEFVSTSDMLIHNINELDSKNVCRCNSKKIMSADFAKYRDYTVFMSVCPMCGIITDMMRFVLIDWPEQKMKMLAFYKNNNCNKLIFDNDASADVLASAVRNEDVRLIPYDMTGPSKKALVSAMVLCLEQGLIKWDFEKYPVIVSELNTFRPEITSKGTITYNAAPNCHDDSVTALALLCTLMIGNQTKPFLMDISDLNQEEKPEEEVNEQTPLFKWMQEE